ncbi:uncharacterized protein C11orf70 homolog [Copidosoma floridanum]|uniref:uncharacterized protein C11orf70 homolog n=1 Tax=Copidosoma floridanum TaxID=29053 RepID=UPI0006C963E1|nr:uncharacterized protein C11orf70 homolog [Copidosoma floridanum]
MELDPDYTFVPLAERHYMGIQNKDTQHYLKKWGLLGNIGIQDFCFNEPFQPYNKYHIAEQFFKSPVVANSLKLKVGDAWMVQGIKATSVDVTPVQCTALNMSFFDKLKNPENKIVSLSGAICKQCDVEIEGFIVSDKLRAMILDEDNERYSLYGPEERDEFIFRLFEMLVLGGSLCQYEDELQPYLDVTRKIYKDLVRVEKKEDRDLSICTTVVRVVASARERGDTRPYFPGGDAENRQNVGFLLIDGSGRRVTSLMHRFGGFNW